MCNTYADASEMSGLLTEVINCKKAAIVAVFFLYLIYIATTALTHFFEIRSPKEKQEIIKKLKLFKLDIEQRQFFILTIALLIQVITPVPFPIVMLYLYLATILVMFVGIMKQDKWIIYFAAVATQLLFAFILLFFVLINPWCRHYYFRYIVSEPPSSFYSVQTSSGSESSNGDNTGGTDTSNNTSPLDNNTFPNDTIPEDNASGEGLGLLL
eukprot:403340395